MLLAENIKEHLSEARSTLGYDDIECTIHHDVARIIPDTIDVENLVLAYKIIINEYEREGENPLAFISVIPSYVKQGVSKDFFFEFRKVYTRELIGIALPDYSGEDYGCTEVEEDIIDISNKNKYEVFAKLYNALPPIGMGFAQYNPIPLDEDLAKLVFEKEGKKDSDGSVSFRYVLGRLMPCMFIDNLLYVRAYNYENADGLAQQIVASCKNVNEKEIAPQKVKKDKNNMIQ